MPQVQSDDPVIRRAAKALKVAFDPLKPDKDVLAAAGSRGKAVKQDADIHNGTIVPFNEFSHLVDKKDCKTCVSGAAYVAPRYSNRVVLACTNKDCYKQHVEAGAFQWTPQVRGREPRARRGRARDGGRTAADFRGPARRPTQDPDAWPSSGRASSTRSTSPTPAGSSWATASTNLLPAREPAAMAEIRQLLNLGTRRVFFRNNRSERDALFGDPAAVEPSPRALALATAHLASRHLEWGKPPKLDSSRRGR